jgi:hypothetical protein
LDSTLHQRDDPLDDRSVLSGRRHRKSVPPAYLEAQGAEELVPVHVNSSHFTNGGFWRLPQQEWSDLLDRLREAEAFAGPSFSSVATHSRSTGLRMEKVGAFREVLEQQSVGVLVGGAPPGCVPVAEIDVDVDGGDDDDDDDDDDDLLPVADLRALVPG